MSKPFTSAKIPTQKWYKMVTRSLSSAVAIALVVNIPVLVTGQSQPPQSAEQSQALEEAKRLNQLVLQLRNEGKYSQGIPLAERVLAIYEKVLGLEHPYVATSLNNLAQLYDAPGNYKKAEPLFQRSLAIYEKVLGKEDPHVATSLNNLALLYWAEGDITRATDLWSRGLTVEDHN